MLKTFSAFFNILRSIIDITLAACCWITVYFLRFRFELFDFPKGIPSFEEHLWLTVPVTCICYLGILGSGQYKSKRTQNFLAHFTSFLKAILLNFLLITVFLYYVKGEIYSRKLLLIFIIMLFAGLSFSHLFAISILKRFRKKGYNTRYYIIIGPNEKGLQLFEDIRNTGWLGLKCLFFVSNDAKQIGTTISDIPVYGPVNKLPELIKDKGVDEIYLTLCGIEAQQAYSALEALQYTGITIRIIPDYGNLLEISKPAVVTVGSQILFSTSDSPLSGYKFFIKQSFDFIVAAFLLILFSIPIILIAILIKMTSKGHVFYKQTRMGMDQKEFEIIKFRTMVDNAENGDNPQWSKPDDKRRTLIGKFLRRTSMDELPQLINVLKGQMSLVGPRPERPYFVKQFSDKYKRYMFRHKVKAGMTGWAQVNSCRGDCSIRKRLLYDLYYVKNWSFAFDLWILIQTPLHIIMGKNAY